MQKQQVTENNKHKQKDEVKPNEVEREYVLDLESKKSETEDEMDDTTDMNMEEYKKRMRDNGPSLVYLENPSTTYFELKGNILTMLKDISFYRKDHEDAYKHIDEVSDIVNYFNVPNVPHETFLLWMLLITLRGAKKDWLRAFLP